LNAFETKKEVERRGMAKLRPYLTSEVGKYLVTNKGVLAKHLQLVAGDVMWNDDSERLWAAEIKVEEKHTGNLFLETWSNRNLSDRASYGERGGNRGWLDHSRADLLMYYFLDSDDLYTLDLFWLKRWAYGYKRPDGTQSPPNIGQYEEKGPYVFQLNETRGVPVKIEILQKALRKYMRTCKVGQLSLFEDAA